MSGMRRIAAFCAAAMLAVGSAGCGAAETFTISGTVEANESNVVSEVTAKVLELKADEGASVKKGDVIAVLDGSMQQLALAQAQAAVDAKKAVLDQLEGGARAEQIAQAEAAVRAAQANLDAAKEGRPEQRRQAQAAVEGAQAGVESARVALAQARENLTRSQALAASGSISEQALDDAQYAVDAASSLLDAAEKQLASARAQLELVSAGSGADAAKAAQAALDQANAQLEQLRNGAQDEEIEAAQAALAQAEASRDASALLLGRYELKAPIDGVVDTDVAGIGEVVAAGGKAAVLIDPEDLYVRMYVPQKYLTLLKVGQEIRVSTSALPGQTVAGTVSYLSDKAEFTPSNTETTESRENTVFLFKIRLNDPPEGIRPGMSVETVLALPEALR